MRELPTSRDDGTKRFLVRPVLPSAESLADLRHAVGQFVASSIPEHVARDLLLALDEAVANALVHGGGRSVMVHVGVHADKVTATVRDSGGGFDVGHLVELWPPSPLGENGRGVYIVTRLMDSVTIRSEGGTIVHMSRALASERDRARRVCVWTGPSLARFAHIA